MESLGLADYLTSSVVPPATKQRQHRSMTAPQGTSRQSGSRSRLHKADIAGVDDTINIKIFPEVGSRGRLSRLGLGLTNVGRIHTSIAIRVADEQTHWHTKVALLTPSLSVASVTVIFARSYSSKVDRNTDCSAAAAAAN